jgi:hypothetical protein
MSLIRHPEPAEGRVEGSRGASSRRDESSMRALLNHAAERMPRETLRHDRAMRVRLRMTEGEAEGCG